MPLIPCPDCGTDISDQATACPKCGRPRVVAAPTASTAKTSAPVAVLLTLATIIGLLSVTPRQWEDAALFWRWIKRMLGVG